MSQQGPSLSPPPSYPMTPSLPSTTPATTTTTVTTLTTTTAAAAAFPGGGDGVPPMATMETLIDSIDRSNNVLSMILRGLFAKVADQERALQAERAQRRDLLEPLGGVRPVAPVPGVGAVRPEQADRLVVVERAHGDARPLGQLADSEVHRREEGEPGSYDPDAA